MERKLETRKKRGRLQTVVAPPETSEDEYLLGSDEDNDLVPENNNTETDDEYESEDEIPLATLAKIHFWKSVPANSPRATPIFHNPNVFREDGWEPIDYFQNFFDADLLNHIVEQSNLYALQSNPNKPLRLTLSELEQFIGVTIYMSIFDLHRTRNYWSEKFRIPHVADVLSRDRYEEIRKHLHFNDNTYQPDLADGNRDHLFKVRPLVDALLSKCRNIPLHGQMFCVDEQIVPFKGHSRLKCYNPKKPHKWGYKIFALCDVRGTVYNFDIYDGQIKPKPGHRDIGCSSNVVLQLASVIPDNNNYLLYFDNWFASPLLFVELHKRGIGAIGTIRINRFPGCMFSSDTELKKKGRGYMKRKSVSLRA